MAAAERMVDFSRNFFLGKMLSRIWTLSFREKTLLRNFAKKAGGAFIGFPRFGSAHCTVLK